MYIKKNSFLITLRFQSALKSEDYISSHLSVDAAFLHKYVPSQSYEDGKPGVVFDIQPRFTHSQLQIVAFFIVKHLILWDEKKKKGVRRRVGAKRTGSHVHLLPSLSDTITGAP